MPQQLRGYRRKAREAALAYLYQHDADVRPVTADLEKFLNHFRVEMDIRDFAKQMILGVLQHSEKIDAAISSASQHWKLYRMESIDRTLLRMAVWELIFCLETDHPVILDEAVEMAQTFGSNNSSSFVNGILDHLAQEFRNPGAQKKITNDEVIADPAKSSEASLGRSVATVLLASAVLFFGQSVSANENNQESVGLHPTTCLAALAIFSQPHERASPEDIAQNARVVGDILAGQRYQSLAVAGAARDSMYGFLADHLSDPQLDVQIVQGREAVGRKLAEWVAAEKRVGEELARIPGDQPRLLEEALSSDPYHLGVELNSFHLYKRLQTTALCRVGVCFLLMCTPIPPFFTVLLTGLSLRSLLEAMPKALELGQESRQSRMDRMDSLRTAESILQEFTEPGAFSPFPRVFGWVTAMPRDSRIFLTKAVRMDRRWLPKKPWHLSGVGARQQVIVLGVAERDGVEEPVLIVVSAPIRITEQTAAE